MNCWRYLADVQRHLIHSWAFLMKRLKLFVPPQMIASCPQLSILSLCSEDEVRWLIMKSPIKSCAFDVGLLLPWLMLQCVSMTTITKACCRHFTAEEVRTGLWWAKELPTGVQLDFWHIGTTTVPRQHYWVYWTWARHSTVWSIPFCYVGCAKTLGSVSLHLIGLHHFCTVMCSRSSTDGACQFNFSCYLASLRGLF